MLRARILLLVAVAVALVAVGTTAALAGTKTIKIGDDWFVRSSSGSGGGPPPTITVARNTTVKWTWTGEDGHNIRARSVPHGVKKSRFSASERSTGTFSRKMTVPGTYKLYCSIHDYEGQAMVLKVLAK